MRTLRSIVLAVIGAALLVPTVLAAGGPEQVHVVIEFPVLTVAECDRYDVVATDGTVDRRMLVWRDASGAELLERRTVHFDITFTNTATGLTGSYTGQFSAELDFVAGTDRLTGNYRKLQVGGRTVLLASGIDFFSEADPEASFIHGRSSLDEFGAGICAAMAG